MKYPTTIFFLFCVTLLYGFASKAQDFQDYFPLQTSSVESQRTIDFIESQLEGQLKAVENPEKKFKKELLRKTSENLLMEIRNEEYIQDEEISLLIDELYQKLKSSNDFIFSDYRFLVKRRTEVNAASLGNGIIIINIGLLRRLQNSQQLAFVLAHEIAHRELMHVKKLTQEWIALTDEFEKNASKKKVSTGDALELLREQVYNGRKFSRSFEEEADSLAYLFLNKAGFDEKAIYETLSILDSAEYPKYNYPVLVSEFFDNQKYPFQEKWIQKSESAFIKNSDGTLFFNRDSLRTHPHIRERIQKISSYRSHKSVFGNENIEEREYLFDFLDFEIIESAFFYNDYDYALFLALQQVHKSPENKYLKTIIAELIIELFFARKDHTFSRYVDHDWQHNKCEEWIVVTDFLHNLRMSELGKLGYHLLNNQNYFDGEIEEHYYLLWTISRELGKTEVEKQSAKAYLNKFPKGKYADELGN